MNRKQDFAAYIFEPELIVRVLNGQIRGRTYKSTHNQTIYAFQEIPYAEPPVGNLRFQEPVPPKNWVGILDTTTNTKICRELRVEKVKDDPRESEDCLYLNVYSPVDPRQPNIQEKLLPVMVYIYGGRFMFGGATLSTIDPQLYVETGIIAVTFNYRSGPLGLFRHAVMLSSTSLIPISITKNARYFAFELGRQFDASLTHRNTSEELLNLLLTIPGSNLTNTLFSQVRSNNYIEIQLAGLYWRPVLEDTSWPNAYITRPMYEEYYEGNVNRVPLFTGIVSEEIRYYEKSFKIADWGHALDHETMLFDNSRVKPENRKDLERELKAIYTNTTFTGDKAAMYRYLSDYFFCVPITRHADMLSKYMNVYFYHFSYHGKLNDLVNKHPINEPGLGNVGHAEDVVYYLYLKGKPDPKNESIYPPEDIITRRRLVKLHSNFIKYGNPTPSEEPLLQNIIWPPLKENKFTYIDINANLSLRNEYPRAYTKWVPLIEKYFERPLTTL